MKKLLYLAALIWLLGINAQAAGPYNTTAVGSPTYVTGKFGQAVSLNGTSYLSIPVPGPADAAFTAASFTAECFVYTASATTRLALEEQGTNTGDPAWYFGTQASGYATAYLSGSTPGNISGTTSIANSTWHHEAFVYTSGTLYFYYDGALVSSAAVSRLVAGGTVTASIGGATGSAYYWSGLIDEVRFSSVARYSGSTYTVPTAAFVDDANTTALYHLDGNGNDSHGSIYSSVSPLSLGASSTGNTVTITGNGTAWVSGTTTFTLASTGTGASITAQTINSATSATLTVNAGTAGTLTYSENTDYATVTQQVSGPTIAVSPASLTASTSGNTVVLTGTYTAWTSGTTFTATNSAGGASITSTSINGQVATLTVTSGAVGVITYADSTDSTTTTQSVVAAANVISVSDANIYYSPWNWYSNGSTAMSSMNIHPGSTFVETVNPGAYSKLAFTASTTCVINVDVTPLAGGSTPAADYPIIDYTIDNQAMQRAQLTSSSTALASFASLSSSTTHYIKYFFEAADPFIDRWNTPVNVVKVTGITLDAGGYTVPLSTTPLAILPKTILFNGDSITEGIYITNETYPGGGDAVSDYAAYTAAGLGCEYGIVAFGGQGWHYIGGGNVTYFFTPGNDTTSSWDKFWSGNSRLSGGLFVPQPTYAVVNMGTNDADNGVSAATVTSDEEGFIPAFRAASPSTRLFILVPFGQMDAAALASGVTAVGDPMTQLINLGPIYGLTNSGPSGGNLNSNDGLHPNNYEHPRLGAMLTGAIQSLLKGPLQ